MQLTDAQRLDWLRLIRTDSVGPRTFRNLVNRFGGASGALDALPAITGRAGKRVTPPSKAEIEREMAAAARLGVRFVATGEDAYPRSLQATDAAPPLIAVRGNLDALARPSLAIVGSRNASAAGLTFTERLARGLGEAGLVVVSGLARGIDASAHKASLTTGTIAVLAGGHDRIYPANHAALVESILEAGGALVAEMPMGWEPRGRDFPRRNRIISGLGLGTLVVEAARRSGSLITARYALEQGREVFAVPGSPLDPRAEGTNDLIRQGATLVAEVEHILSAIAPLLERGDPFGAGQPFSLIRQALEEQPDFWDEIDLDGTSPASPDTFSDPATEIAPPLDDRVRLLSFLSPTPIGTDELSRAAGLSVRIVQTALLELELDGRVERHGNGAVSLSAR
ncbi:DNA-processing protein DprA [Methylobacterium brachythecii]|uniref:DNA processing protein n=1 Tax=Methylobacterium brachythecii TaxID=1176177 RepID=A0A7W6AK81_9HYPH|nr:DNA-processing protein DprA [Methylobacterium brachythecii]MBB3902684.1 DNA processing protein [Methylobacterium brachythecii]GLS42529.1 DNA processing protein DprA [Methylobacterium brachythecii]